MPDFGILETLGALGIGGDALGLGGIFGASAIPELAAASVPLDIGAATGFGAGADAAALAAGSTGLASGLGETAALGALAGAPTAGAVASETLGAGAGSLDTAAGFGGASAALPSASGLTTADLSLPGVTGTGPVTTPTSLVGPLGTQAPGVSAPVSPISAAASAPTDLTSAGSFTGTGGGTGGTSGAGTSLLDKLSPSNLASGAVNQVAKNPLGTAAGLGALGVGLLGNKAPAGTNQLGGIAAAQGAQGQQLQQYLTSGTLPAGMQQSVTAATQAAKQKIISNYASRNMPTDPTKNSSLAAELAAVDQNSIITTAQLGQQLLTTGLDETKLSADVYNKLVGIDQTQQQQIQSAIANFAKALGGGGGVQLKLA